MFKFRLQSVLDHRNRQEEEKQRELALVNAEQVHARGALAALEQGRAENAAALTALLRTAHDPKVLRLYDDFLQGRDADIRWKARELEQIGERLRAKQLELQEYLRRRKTLEIYRERMKAAYEKEEKKREVKFTDEVAQMMWFREQAQ
ncbi:MAG: flagellar export protein FliJ [Nitrospinae bacterium]|nr:flagellar export protein FliJ [Nitrospinota bacterium]